IVSSNLTLSAKEFKQLQRSKPPDTVAFLHRKRRAAPQNLISPPPQRAFFVYSNRTYQPW
ncbi:hypothetical protein NJI34_44130, partial [Pseudomonas sp. S 311-6]|nr:hypothetical protein [Pseudomonas sp. S 311-6]